jgi:hypothetical protein
MPNNGLKLTAYHGAQQKGKRQLSPNVHRTKAWKIIGSMGVADERQRIKGRAGLLAGARLPTKADDPQRSRFHTGRPQPSGRGAASRRDKSSSWR